MSPERRRVFTTFGLALLLLPLCLAAWYVAGIAVTWLPAHLASPAIGMAAGRVQKVEIAARSVTYVVEVEGKYRPGGTPRVEARVDVKAANYTYGVALFVALALAARGWRRPARFAAGLAMLWVLPTFGITFEALRNIGLAAELGALLNWGGGVREAIALGYQVGSLLLPTLAPIITWLALYPDNWGQTPIKLI